MALLKTGFFSTQKDLAKNRDRPQIDISFIRKEFLPNFPNQNSFF